MIKKENTVEMDEADLTAIIDMLSSTLKTRLIRTECNVPDPVDLTGEFADKDQIFKIKSEFKKEVNDAYIKT